MSAPLMESELRQKAAARIKERRDFYAHVIVYAFVNAFLVGLWVWVTGQGFFWPIFPLFFWGLGLAMHAYDTFVVREITESDIDREVTRMAGRR